MKIDTLLNTNQGLMQQPLKKFNGDAFYWQHQHQLQHSELQFESNTPRSLHRNTWS